MGFVLDPLCASNQKLGCGSRQIAAGSPNKQLGAELTLERGETSPRSRLVDVEVTRCGTQRVLPINGEEVRFTALLHHITIDLLKRRYIALKRDAAPGIDGVTWRTYGENLDEKLKDLHERIHRGSYRARPARRTYIPKADGTQRPLSVWCLEDKIVQQAVVKVLEPIYEEDFVGFSYGFRPGRGQHDALDAIHVGILRKRVNWVLDADIQGGGNRTRAGPAAGSVA
jgi:hypothetical protein